MEQAKKIFHYISYIQYPLMLLALYHAILPYIVGFDTVWTNFNKVLIFAGLGISFSTLQDTRITQNKFSKRIWEDPRKGKITLLMFSTMTFFFLVIGTYGYFASSDGILEEMSIGVIVFGIGMMGMLKSAMEMFENHVKREN